jgi:hypothetical protein
MNPTLVPTLAELHIELQRAIAAHANVTRNLDLARLEGAVTAVFEDALQRFETEADNIAHQIAVIDAASLADIRVHAYALAWLHAKPDGFELPMCERRLATQLVAGLMNEEIA